jgi:hypothetical protein
MRNRATTGVANLVRTFVTSTWVGALALSACMTVEQDDFISEGGNAPDPTAIVDGTIVYSGPRPSCVINNGRVERVVGNVILTLFAYDNPPPPEGTASSSLNLLVVSGDALFDEADCWLEPSVHVTRSVEYRWPRLPLAPGGQESHYQVRGFYDYDADMVPFFSVTRLPTAGDVIGAALNNLSDPSQGPLRITLPARESAPDGFVRSGVTVALGNVVRTERPLFRLDENRKLAANTPFPFPPPTVGTLQTFRQLTCARGADVPDCGMTLKRFAEDEKARLDPLGVDVDLGNPARTAIYTSPVDITTVVPGGVPDLATPDGNPDPHPFLGGTLGVPWYAPMVLLQRLNPDPAQAAIEAQARIPRVLMVGSVLLDGDTKQPLKASYTGDVPIAMPPVAALELIAGDRTCRIPYFAPGTNALIMDRRLAECAELPAAYYTVNVLAGLAGGSSSPPAEPALHESGQVITGARYSGQAWSIPNELALTAQVRAGRELPDQGLEGTFVVHDPTDDPAEGKDACQVGNLFGICPGAFEVGENEEGADSPKCLPAVCCEAIAHLYDPQVQRCPKVVDALGNRVSTGPTRVLGTAASGAAIPDCVPFDLPALCRPPGV